MDPRALEEEVGDQQPAEVRRVGDAAGSDIERTENAIAPMMSTKYFAGIGNTKYM